MTTIDRWITHWARHRPDHPAMRFEGAEITYGDLEARIAARAAWLIGNGVTAGDRVVHCGHNNPELVVSLFACARLGSILVPLNNRLAVAEHRYQLEDATPRLAVTTDGFAAAITEAASALPVHELPAHEPIGAGPPRPPSPAPASAAGPDDPLLMVYTSGTTGRPKGAVHTQSSLLHTVLNGVAHQDLTAEDRILTVLPLFHVGGLNIQTLPALYVGASVEIHRRFDPGQCLAAIARFRPTQTLFVPAVMTAVINHPDFDITDLGCLRGLNSGSSVIPDQLIEAFLDRGVPVGQVYGSTETGPTAVVLRFADGADHVGSCGKAALHTEVRIVDGDGGDVAAGAAGELLVRGPNLFREYWRQPEATAAAFLDGWYRTGDVARADEHGFIHIEDRLGDVLISGGENVYPAEVENVLIGHPDIADVAVISAPDRRWGEIPVAVIEVEQPGVEPTVEQLRAWCDSRLARFKQPRRVLVVDELPRTALGKVTKHVLREELR